jgi:hypothetical protein
VKQQLNRKPGREEEFGEGEVTDITFNGEARKKFILMKVPRQYPLVRLVRVKAS